MPKKLTIEDMHKAAQELGGKCLSSTYVNSKTKLSWECSQGHRWEAIPNSVKNGSWCPQCAYLENRRKNLLTLGDVMSLAEKRGGKCLSKTYTGTFQKLLWECSEKHQWKATHVSVNRGTWCPHCSGVAKHTLKKMRQVANVRSGKCLSKRYKNAVTNLTWECSEGHQWEATPSNIMSGGTWCPQCAKQRMNTSPKLTIEEMRQIAVDRGGKCLSEVYTNIRTKLLWECKEGHTWEATPHGVKRGSWCPECTKQKS